MADIRITALPPATGLADADVLHGVQDADNKDRKFSLSDLSAYVLGGTGNVNSVFGRNGDIVATEGDYSLDLLGDVDLTTTAPVAKQVLAYNGTAWVPTAPSISPVGGLSLSYKWNAATASADPGTGRAGANNASVEQATEIYINDTTDKGNNLGVVWANLAAGDIVGLWDAAGTVGTFYFQITSVTDNTGWHTLGVTNVPTGTGTIPDGDDVQVFLIDNPARKLPPGGSAGQLLSKVGATDYSVHWSDPFSLPDGTNVGQRLRWNGTAWEPSDLFY